MLLNGLAVSFTWFLFFEVAFFSVGLLVDEQRAPYIVGLCPLGAIAILGFVSFLKLQVSVRRNPRPKIFPHALLVTIALTMMIMVWLVIMSALSYEVWPTQFLRALNLLAPIGAIAILLVTLLLTFTSRKLNI